MIRHNFLSVAADSGVLRSRGAEREKKSSAGRGEDRVVQRRFQAEGDGHRGSEDAIVCDFITEGHFGRHLRRMREIYAERLAILLEESRLRLAGLLELSTVEAGLQTTGWLCRVIDAESAAEAAAKRRIDVTPLSRYRQGKVMREGLQLGFAAFDAREIRRGVRELAIALEGEMKGRDGARRAGEV
jgi:DNA-binding transcriptional MocR family regulator